MDRYFSCRIENPVTIAVFSIIGDADAGEKLTFTGPSKTLEVPRSLIPAVYRNLLPAPAVADVKDLPPPVFGGGLWQFAAPCGATIAPFQQPFTLPPPLRWTNRASFASINRAEDQLIQWASDGYTPHDVITTRVSSSYFPQALPGAYLGSSVICRARASAGRLTIPSDFLKRIPPSARLPSSASGRPELRLSRQPWQRDRFTVPAVTGAPEPAIIDYLFTDQLKTDIR